MQNGCVTVLLVGGGFSVLLGRIRRSKQETQVKLFELELRLAELAQRVTPASSDAPASQS
jgi:hypothetical protein